jgi:hypothetical protein
LLAFEQNAAQHLRPPRLHHINLKTSHLNEMVKWYSTKALNA